jgi:hypothetical protein
MDWKDVKHVVIVGLPYSIEQALQFAGRMRGYGKVTVIVPAYQLRESTDLAGDGWCSFARCRCGTIVAQLVVCYTKNSFICAIHHI